MIDSHAFAQGVSVEAYRLVLLAFSESNIQLVPDGTLLFHLAIIAAMVALLNVTLLKPITRILDERERRTRGRFTEAESLLAQVNEKMREYERRMREARAGGYALLEQQRGAVSRERDRKIAEFKTEVADGLRQQKEVLRTDVDQMRASLEKDARTRALEIGHQILGRQITVDRLPGSEQG
jgi:F-type H+-transporting ATPase subunit b